MFVTRLLSGIVLVLAAIILLFYGDVWLVGALLVLSQIGIYELLRVFRLDRHPAALVVYMEAAVYYILLYLGHGWWTMGLLVLELVILLVLYVARFPRDRIDRVAECFFVSVYVPLLLSFIYQTRCLQGGTWLVWLIIIGSWGSDTCAYVVGVLAGRHHFSALSPKKTIEGCVGGVVGAALIGYGFACFFPYQDMFLLSPRLVFPLVVVISAVISQFGDLAASAIKRNYEIKDYGNLILGHGGVLDRFDSVIFVAPFVYYLLVLASYI